MLLHTAGFGYDFFNHDLVEYGHAKNVPSVVSRSMDSLRSVLVHEPGERWEYGSHIDWAGKVEGACGKRLGAVFSERIFGPLDMNDSSFEPTASMRQRRVTMHRRSDDGPLTPLPDFELPPNPEQHMGGHGLYATVGDYMTFIRMVLNDGASAHRRMLKAETAARMSENGLGDLKIRLLPGAIPSLSNDAEFFPLSWIYGAHPKRSFHIG